MITSSGGEKKPQRQCARTPRLITWQKCKWIDSFCCMWLVSSNKRLCLRLQKNLESSKYAHSLTFLWAYVSRCNWYIQHRNQTPPMTGWRGDCYIVSFFNCIHNKGSAVKISHARYAKHGSNAIHSPTNKSSDSSSQTNISQIILQQAIHTTKGWVSMACKRNNKNNPFQVLDRPVWLLFLFKRYTYLPGISSLVYLASSCESNNGFPHQKWAETLERRTWWTAQVNRCHWDTSQSWDGISNMLLWCTIGRDQGCTMLERLSIWLFFVHM